MQISEDCRSHWTSRRNKADWRIRGLQNSQCRKSRSREPKAKSWGLQTLWKFCYFINNSQ